MSSEDSPRVSTWVPQVFFDLIARVVPGTITIGALILAGYGPSRVLRAIEHWLQYPPESSPAILIIVLVLTLSYALAIILWGIWCIGVGIQRKVRRKSRVEFETGVDDPEGEFPVQYDFIKRNDPQAGNRITKLKAEIHLSSVLVVGLSISLLVDLANWNDSSTGRGILAILLLSSIAGSASSWRFFAHRTRTAVKNQCRLLRYADWCSGALTVDTNQVANRPIPVETAGMDPASTAEATTRR